MTKLPAKNQLEAAQQKNLWDFGNAMLYKLCKDNFEHKSDDAILTKVLFIGRIYAAAVERRKNKSDDTNDNFYSKTVGPTFRKSKLDDKLSGLKIGKTENIEHIKSVLETHYYLTNMLKKSRISISVLSVQSIYTFTFQICSTYMTAEHLLH